jgi:hypothetical protein
MDWSLFLENPKKLSRDRVLTVKQVTDVRKAGGKENDSSS